MMAQQPTLTLLLPTFQRQPSALRQVSRWAGDERVVVLVLDGSPEPHGELVTLADRYANVKYLHWPIDLRQRLTDCLPLIETPFVALINDDDYFLKSGVFFCLDELNRRAELLACMGTTLVFRQEGQELQFKEKYESTVGRDLDGVDVVARIKKHFLPYAPTTVYAITRTGPWIKAMRLATQQKYSCVYTGEFLFEMCMSLQGQSCVSPVLMWLRAKASKPVSTTGWNRRLLLAEWLQGSQWGSEVELFKRCTVELLKQEFSLEAPVAEAYLHESIENYLRNDPSILAKTFRKLKGGVLRLVSVKGPVSWENFVKVSSRLKAKGITIAHDEMKLFIEENRNRGI